MSSGGARNGSCLGKAMKGYAKGGRIVDGGFKDPQEKAGTQKLKFGGRAKEGSKAEEASETPAQERAERKAGKS